MAPTGKLASASAAVTNVLDAWLVPLTALRESLDGLAEAETEVTEAHAAIDSIRQQAADAVRDLKDIERVRAEAEANLATRLVEIKEAAAEARKVIERELIAARNAKTKEIDAMEADFAARQAEIHRSIDEAEAMLTAKRKELVAVEARKADAEAALAQIARVTAPAAR